MDTSEPVDALEPAGTHPRYDKYEDSGVDWLGEIPSHWDVVPLRYYCDIPTGQVDPEEEQNRTRVLISPNHVEQDTGRILEQETAHEQGASSGKYPVEPGDIIYSKIRPELNKACLAEGDWLCSADMYPIKIRKGYEARYLKYLILSQAFKHLMVNDSMRVAMPKVNRDTLNAARILHPPLDEQRAIAAFLDRETERIDALIEKKERLIDLLEEKRTALISRVVTKGLDADVEMQDSGVEWLGEIPAHWKTGKVAHLLENLDSERIPVSASNRADMQGKYPYYGASGVIDHVDDYLFDEPLILVAEDGANLFSRSTPLAFVARGKYWVNNHAHILRPRYEPLQYWAYVLRSIVYDPWITGAAQPKLTQENLGSISLPVPPENEREQITERLNQERRNINALTEMVEQAIDRLKEYRKAIISEAVTGKIKVAGVKR